MKRILFSLIAVFLAAGFLAGCQVSESVGIQYLDREKVVVEAIPSPDHMVTENIKKAASDGCGRYGKTAEYVGVSHGLHHQFLFLCR